MGHINKGVLGIRLDGSKKIEISNLYINNLINKSNKSKYNKLSKYNNCIQVMANHNMPKLNDITANVFGIVISKNSKININNTCIENLKSKNGKVFKTYSIN